MKAAESSERENADRKRVIVCWLGVEGDLRTLPPRSAEETLAVSLPGIAEP